MNSQIVTVNLVPGLSTPAVVRVSQYDVGRPILFKVFDGTMPASFESNTIATVVGTKPSGLGFSEVAAISGNTASLNSTLAMTQEAGMIQAEVRFSIQYGPDIGTANFILAVEPSPHPEGTTDGTQETMANLETRLQGQIDALDTRVDALEAGQGGGSGLTDDVKNALLQIAQKVAYIDAHGQDYYDDLYDALYNDTTRSVLLVLSHVSSSNSQSTVEVGDSYTTTLTASTNYTLNSVSVTMGGVDITSTAYSSGTVSIPSVTGNIVITATAVLAAQSITATYTQSGTVYDTATLDSLKADLVVTANYSGGTSETVPSSDYTLSGTLTEGTSTITVSYAGLTDTFNVTVTSSRPSNPYVIDNMTLWLDGIYNKSTGHDASATSWENLITEDLFTNTGITVVSDGVVFDGTAGHGFLGDIPSSPTTIEVVIDVTTPSTTQVVINGFGNNNNGNVTVKSNALLQRKGSSNGGTHALSTGLHTHTFVIGTAQYVDGVEVSGGTTTVSWGVTPGKMVIGNAVNSDGSLNSSSSAYPFTGTIKCIRFYSDALTAEEVASNFSVDATRFGIS